MFPEGYHQYHMRFDTDIRDAAHINNGDIADFIEWGRRLEDLIQRARDADSTAKKLEILRELKDFEPWHLTHMRYPLLEALSDVDPQTYVNLNTDVKSTSWMQEDGAWITYEKQEEYR